MRFVINNKVYDTEKMTLIGTVRKWYEIKNVLFVRAFGEGAGRMFDCNLFRSQKGNYLLSHDHGNDNIMGEAITEEEAKELLLHYNYDAYCKLFGELEEA